MRELRSRIWATRSTRYVKMGRVRAPHVIGRRSRNVSMSRAASREVLEQRESLLSRTHSIRVDLRYWTKEQASWTSLSVQCRCTVAIDEFPSHDPHHLCFTTTVKAKPRQSRFLRDQTTETHCCLLAATPQSLIPTVTEHVSP